MDRKYLLVGGVVVPLVAALWAGPQSIYAVSDTSALSAGLGIHKSHAKPRKRPKRDLSANEMMQIPRLGIDAGKGKVVAVIDTGFSLEPALSRVSDMSQARFENSAEVQAALNAAGITYGSTMLNDKVVFAYNYADNSNTISGNEQHGTHVAGIMAANPAEDHLIARGVLPEAQLVLMKVFNQGGADPAIFVRAIKDAVKLNVDVINLSLGGAGSSYADAAQDSDLQAALQEARDKGILVVFAAGNSGAAFNAQDGVSSDVVEYGTLASPALDPSVIAVGAQENLKTVAWPITGYIYDEAFNGQPADERIADFKTFTLKGFLNKDNLPSDFKDKHVGIVDCGMGDESDFDGKDLTGKVALVRRGKTTFEQMGLRAAARHASAVLLAVDTQDQDLIPDLGTSKLPFLVIDNSSIEWIKGNASLNNVSLSFSVEPQQVNNSAAADAAIPDFSSWGSVSDAPVLKPDIIAPGGSVYSTVKDGFDILHGTSMAAPNLAGASVLIRDHAQKFSTDPQEVRKLTLQFMMSYAEPQSAQSDAPGGPVFYSPRLQGAGLVKVENALKGDVVLNNPQIDRPSFQFKQVGNTIDLVFQVKNLGDSTREYSYNARLLKDSVEEGTHTLAPMWLKQTQPVDIVVGPHETKDVSLSIDISDIASPEEPYGFFVDGYVCFTSKDSDVPDMHLPFSAFKGDFDAYPAFEDSVYTLKSQGKQPLYYHETGLPETPSNTPSTAYLFTGLNTMMGAKKIILGDQKTAVASVAPKSFADHSFDEDQLVLSPNGDGYLDGLTPQMTLLRAVTDVKATIAKKEAPGVPLVSLPTYKSFDIYRKNISGEPDPETQETNGVTEFARLAWTGLDSNNTTLPDGDYLYTLSVTPVGSATPQKLSFPVKIDTKAPTVTSSSFDESSRTFVLKATDDGVGIGLLRAEIVLDGVDKPLQPTHKTQGMSALSTGVASTDETHELRFVLPAGADPQKAKLRLIDAAFNKVEIPLMRAVVDAQSYSIVLPTITEDNKTLDVVYKVVDSEGQIVPEDSLSDLKAGTYTVSVESVPTGYEVVGDRRVTVELTAESPQARPSFDIRKKKTIANVFFTVEKDAYPAEPQLFLVDKSDSSSRIALTANGNGDLYTAAKVPYGEYTIEDASLDKDYLLHVDPETISINENTKDVVLGRVSYTKKETPVAPVETGKVIFDISRNGVTGPILYEVVKKDAPEEVVATFQHDIFGMQETLPYGSYILRSKTTKDGFVFKPVEFDVNSARTKVKAQFDEENSTPVVDMGSVWIQASSESEYKGDPLTFVLTNTETSEVFEASFASGKTFAKAEIPLGTYRIALKGEAPAGYTFVFKNLNNGDTFTLSSKSIPKTVVYEAKEVATPVTPEPEPEPQQTGVVSFDISRNGVTGPIEYEVVKKDAPEEVVATFQHDAFGMSETLPYGSYVLRAKTVKDGYVFKPVEFEVNASKLEVTAGFEPETKVVKTGSVWVQPSSQNTFTDIDLAFKLTNTETNETFKITWKPVGQAETLKVPVGTYSLELVTKLPDGVKGSIVFPVDGKTLKVEENSIKTIVFEYTKEKTEVVDDKNGLVSIDWTQAEGLIDEADRDAIVFVLRGPGKKQDLTEVTGAQLKEKVKLQKGIYDIVEVKNLPKGISLKDKSLFVDDALVSFAPTFAKEELPVDPGKVDVGTNTETSGKVEAGTNTETSDRADAGTNTETPGKVDVGVGADVPGVSDADAQTERTSTSEASTNTDTAGSQDQITQTEGVSDAKSQTSTQNSDTETQADPSTSDASVQTDDSRNEQRLSGGENSPFVKAKQAIGRTLAKTGDVAGIATSVAAACAGLVALIVGRRKK